MADPFSGSRLTGGPLVTAENEGDWFTAVNPPEALTAVKPDATGRGAGSAGGVGLSGVASTGLGVSCTDAVGTGVPWCGGGRLSIGKVFLFNGD